MSYPVHDDRAPESELPSTSSESVALFAASAAGERSDADIRPRARSSGRLRVR